MMKSEDLENLPGLRAPSDPQQIPAPCCKTWEEISLPEEGVVASIKIVKSPKTFAKSDIKSIPFEGNVNVRISRDIFDRRSAKKCQKILAPWQSDCAGQGRTQSSGWKRSVAPCKSKKVTGVSYPIFLVGIIIISITIIALKPTWCYKRHWCPWTALYQTHGQALPLSHRLWLPAKYIQNISIMKSARQNQELSDLCHNMLSVLGAVHLQLCGNVGKSDPTVGKADRSHLATNQL